MHLTHISLARRAAGGILSFGHPLSENKKCRPRVQHYFNTLVYKSAEPSQSAFMRGGARGQY